MYACLEKEEAASPSPPHAVSIKAKILGESLPE